MRWCILVAILLSTATMAQDVDEVIAPLPEWSKEDKSLLDSGVILPGVSLLAPETLSEGDANDDSGPLLIVPDRIIPVPAQPEIDPIPLSDDREVIPQILLERYFGGPPEEGLNDEQRLMSMQEKADLKYVLNRHRDVSLVPIYLFLFDEQQRVPEAYHMEVVFDQYLSNRDRPCLVVYYYLGEPTRAQYYLGGGDSDILPKWKVSELLSSASMKAREKSNRYAQLENYVGELSMRLFWVEEMLVEAEHHAQQAQAAEERANNEQVEEEGSWLDGVSPQLRWLAMTLGALTLVTLCLVYYYSRKSYKLHHVIVNQRLGGLRGAGSSGVLNFGDAKRSPTDQREQFEQLL